MDKSNILNHFKRKHGDRYDGWRVKNVDAVFKVIPFILRTRLDAQNLYEEAVPIDHIEEFIKKHKEDIPGLTIMHVMIAVMVRLISQRPQLNRFIVYNKLFARNHISFAIAIKRSLTDEGEETIIKPCFLPTDTLQDIVKKVNDELMNNKSVGQQNESDEISKILGYLPDFMMRFVVKILFGLDKYGLLPKIIHDASPWHSSVFLTNLGSIGVNSIYHHLYEFGTCSVFMAMGTKIAGQVINRKGEVVKQKQINVKMVMDERICDGFYYAYSLRIFTRYFNNLDLLLTPPEKVVIDKGVRTTYE